MELKIANDETWVYEEKYNVYAMRTYPWSQDKQANFGSAWGLLKEGMETSVHIHEDEGETFFIVQGRGIMRVDDEFEEMGAQTTVYIGCGSPRGTA